MLWASPLAQSQCVLFGSITQAEWVICEKHRNGEFGNGSCGIQAFRVYVILPPSSERFEVWTWMLFSLMEESRSTALFHDVSRNQDPKVL